ncbi:MAG: hypothetical protein ACO1RX_01900 [Candidatus Sericytochromatia bacterium]
MPNLTRLHSEDYMALTRSMDTNRNNRVDNNEAKINWRAQQEIGNSNGVAGTRELATALEKGDVFMTSLSPETAGKIADYFSKHNENFKKPVAEWVSDAWISKEDFDFDPAVRQAVDTNADNRISNKEFAAALVSGTLTIGAAGQVSQNPYTQQPGHTQNPFQNTKPATPPAHSQNPFNKPAGDTKPATPGYTKPADPFQQQPYDRPIPDSGAYLQIDMVRSMRSDYEKGQVLSQLAQRRDLSPREQVMLAEAVTHVSSDYTRGQILQTLASNPSLHEEGVIKVAKMAREISSDHTKNQLLNTLVNSQELTPRGQQSVIISMGTLSSEYSMTQSLIGLINNERLHPENKELLVRTVQEKVSSDYSKRQILDALF